MVLKFTVVVLHLFEKQNLYHLKFLSWVLRL
jgi:hypothetical protein